MLTARHDWMMMTDDMLRLVRQRGAQNTRQQNDVVGSTDTT